MNQSFEQWSGRSPVRAFLRQAGTAFAAAALLRQLAVAAGGEVPAGQVSQPRIAGDWWQIAGDPDLGELTTPDQQPVDFGIWQAADGAWQLWSCIRRTKAPGNTRLFHRWQSARLTDNHWKPMGIAMRADAHFSGDPLDFGVDRDGDHFLCTLPVAAPEILRYKDDWVIAALLPNLKGIQVSHLTWEKSAEPHAAK